MVNCQHGNQLEARYSNDFKVGHNAFEFLLDFGLFYPDSSEARLHTRIVTHQRLRRRFRDHGITGQTVASGA